MKEMIREFWLSGGCSGSQGATEETTAMGGCFFFETVAPFFALNQSRNFVQSRTFLSDWIRNTFPKTTLHHPRTRLAGCHCTVTEQLQAGRFKTASGSDPLPYGTQEVMSQQPDEGGRPNFVFQVIKQKILEFSSKRKNFKSHLNHSEPRRISPLLWSSEIS